MSRHKYDGRLFQPRGPAAVKHLSPYGLWVGGTMQVLSTADLRKHWPLSATRSMSSVKYEQWSDCNNTGFLCIAARMLDYTISATQHGAVM